MLTVAPLVVTYRVFPTSLSCDLNHTQDKEELQVSSRAQDYVKYLEVSLWSALTWGKVDVTNVAAKHLDNNQDRRLDERCQLLAMLRACTHATGRK